MLENEYVKFEGETRAYVYGTWVFERELGCVLRDWFVVFGSLKVKRLELSVLSPTQIRLSKLVFVEEPQLMAKLKSGLYSYDLATKRNSRKRGDSRVILVLFLVLFLVFMEFAIVV